MAEILSFWNQSIDLHTKSVIWLVYERDLRYERVKLVQTHLNSDFLQILISHMSDFCSYNSYLKGLKKDKQVHLTIEIKRKGITMTETSFISFNNFHFVNLLNPRVWNHWSMFLKHFVENRALSKKSENMNLNNFSEIGYLVMTLGRSRPY